MLPPTASATGWVMLLGVSGVSGVQGVSGVSGAGGMRGVNGVSLPFSPHDPPPRPATTLGIARLPALHPIFPLPTASLWLVQVSAAW